MDLPDGTAVSDCGLPCSQTSVKSKLISVSTRSQDIDNMLMITFMNTITVTSYNFPPFSFSSLLSQVGGSVGLWLGMGLLQVGYLLSLISYILSPIPHILSLISYFLSPISNIFYSCVRPWVPSSKGSPAVDGPEMCLQQTTHKCTKCILPQWLRGSCYKVPGGSW